MNSPFERLILIPSRGFSSQTVRQIAHMDGGGSNVRIRLDNRFGDEPLVIDAARVAIRLGADRIDPHTDTEVPFDGGPGVTVAPGTEVVSDPVDLRVVAGDDVAVSMYLSRHTGLATYANAALETAFVADGDQVRASSLSGAEESAERFFLSGIDVLAEAAPRVGVAFGDSLTAGALTTMNTNRRYPNLVNRKSAAGWLVNAGIGGNRLLTDEIGERGLKRLDHDVLAVPGVGWVVVSLGVNDLGLAGGLGLPNVPVAPMPTEAQLMAGYTELVDRCHVSGLHVVLATIPPFAGALYPGFDSPEGRETRRTVNDWMRTTPIADAVADFAEALASPEDPDALRPDFNSGDFVHPNDEGARAMADRVDASLGDWSRR